MFFLLKVNIKRHFVPWRYYFHYFETWGERENKLKLSSI